MKSRLFQSFCYYHKIIRLRWSGWQGLKMLQKFLLYFMYHIIAEIVYFCYVIFKCCLFQIETPNGEVKKAKEVQRDEKTTVTGEMREEVETLYKLRLPDEFFQFWEFCKGLNADYPQGIYYIDCSISIPALFTCFLQYYIHPQINKYIHINILLLIDLILSFCTGV